MENIGKIMVAFDLSEYSVETLKYACKLAEEVRRVSSLSRTLA